MGLYWLSMGLLTKNRVMDGWGDQKTLYLYRFSSFPQSRGLQTDPSLTGLVAALPVMQNLVIDGRGAKHLLRSHAVATQAHCYQRYIPYSKKSRRLLLTFGGETLQ